MKARRALIAGARAIMYFQHTCNGPSGYKELDLGIQVGLAD